MKRPRGMVTDRSVNVIADSHKIDLEEFEGKLVLDLCSGGSNLQYDLGVLGVNCSVVALDAGERGFRDKLLRTPLPDMPVLANGLSLPFQDDTFDIVISTYGLPYWANDIGEVRQFISEAYRVVKKGGSLSVYPSMMNPNEEWEMISRDGMRMPNYILTNLGEFASGPTALIEQETGGVTRLQKIEELA